ncbi:MAG: histidine kinase dimerization/phosphoacceptor domain -containing protein [Dongiaceae bacterium]
MNESVGSVLYIDDDPGIARLVQKDLQRHGFAVSVASTGAAGLRRLAEGGIDAVGLDHYMPDQDGLATLAAIQALPDPPPVVYVTGTEEGKVAIAALRAGAADYVVKDVEGVFLPLLRRALSDSIEKLRLRQARDAAEAEIRAARDRFAELAHQRELLLREVNHRVSNSLQLIASLLGMQAKRNGDQACRRALAEAHDRVLAVSQLHRQLYAEGDVRFVPMDRYLGGLVEELGRSIGGDALPSVDCRVEPIRLETDRAVTVGLVVTELVINALKHAYPEGGGGPVRVRLSRRDAETLELAVEDEGVGYAPDAGSRTGLGEIIVASMAAKLGGQPARDPGHRGTRVRISFPERRGEPGD